MKDMTLERDVTWRSPSEKSWSASCG